MGAHSTSCCRGRPRRCWFRFRVMGFGQSAGKGRGDIFFVREDVWRVDNEVGRDNGHGVSDPEPTRGRPCLSGRGLVAG